MSLETHVVSSEVAYDLVQDHTETLLMLLDHPMQRSELVARLGSSKVLDRLLRHGLLIGAKDDTFRAVAGVYQQVRQEGMMSFLQRYILPALNASLAERTDGTSLTTRALRLSEQAMRALRQGRVRALAERLAGISDEPASGPLSRLTIFVAGTSRISDHELPEQEAAVLHLQRACLQRATPDERDLAVLTQFDFLADASRHAHALEAMAMFIESLQPDLAPSYPDASYHLTIASHWRVPARNDAPLMESRQ